MKYGQFQRKTEARLPKFLKFQSKLKLPQIWCPICFWTFRTSADRVRPIAWVQKHSHGTSETIFWWYLIMSIRCQNFSSIGPIDQKFGVFIKMAFKSTALWPLKVMDKFLDTILVVLDGCPVSLLLYISKCLKSSIFRKEWY